jgi:hypothetical protein
MQGVNLALPYGLSQYDGHVAAHERLDNRDLQVLLKWLDILHRGGAALIKLS